MIYLVFDNKFLFLAGRPTLTECQSTLADGLAVPLVGGNAYATAAPLIDKIVSVRLVFTKRK
jgi:threonine dehydratase